MLKIGDPLKTSIKKKVKKENLTQMVKIRLKRLGYKKNPIYRIVVINSQSKREGATIAELGNYNPKTKEMKLNKELALDWIKKGAQPSETVAYLIKNADEEGKLVYTPKTEKKLSKKAQAKLEAEKEAKKTQKAEAKVEEQAAATAEAPVQEAEISEPVKETEVKEA